MYAIRSYYAPDLLTIDLSDVLPDLKNKRLRGRLVGNRVVPYYSRAEIVERGLEKTYPERVLLWVDDAVELFFLQIQGSGRVKLPDGRFVRLGYADQNGHPYKAIGRVLADRGEIPIEQVSMQNIQSWARANPARLGELLNTNPSYVFFRRITSYNVCYTKLLRSCGLIRFESSPTMCRHRRSRVRRKRSPGPRRNRRSKPAPCWSNCPQPMPIDLSP